MLRLLYTNTQSHVLIDFCIIQFHLLYWLTLLSGFYALFTKTLAFHAWFSKTLYTDTMSLRFTGRHFYSMPILLLTTTLITLQLMLNQVASCTYINSSTSLRKRGGGREMRISSRWNATSWSLIRGHVQYHGGSGSYRLTALPAPWYLSFLISLFSFYVMALDKFILH